MVELFETIMNYPLQFLLGLGLSSGTIYVVCKFIAWLISLCLKKKLKTKEKTKNETLANLVVSKLGGVDAFIDKVAVKVSDIMISSIDDFKLKLQEVLERENCPVEIKAYIQTVLSQKGNEQINLLYQQAKRELLSVSKMAVSSTISPNNETLVIEEQKTQNTEQNTTETKQNIQESEQNVQKRKHKKHKSEQFEDGDITYV